MILILIAIIVAAVVGCVLLVYFDNGYEGRHFVAGISGIVICIATAGVAITYAVGAWQWLSADAKAKIINREYGTHYTREEIFYASDVIDTIRQIDRKRIEVNGDLMRANSDKNVNR